MDVFDLEAKRNSFVKRKNDIQEEVNVKGWTWELVEKARLLNIELDIFMNEVNEILKLKGL